MVIPSRRRGGMTNKWLQWTLCLLYTSSLTNAAIDDQSRVSVIASGSDPPQASRHAQAGRSPAEIPQLTHNIPPKFRNTNEEAGKYDHALAPASLQPAVRAPTTQSIESSGLSLQDGARRLLDWEADDIILLSTIDGALHARDRRSGRRRWELKMPDPMIQATNYAQNKSHQDGFEGQADYIFIVEPSGDGQLYAQFADPKVGLMRLPATVRKMATEIPFIMKLHGRWLATTSQQESKAYTIDAQTGEILHEFPRSKSSVKSDPQPRCRRRSGLDPDDSACRPGRTLRLGRNIYTFTISNEETREELCEIRFAEWVTNRFDHDLQDQHLSSLDNYDVRVGLNGLFWGFDVSTEQSGGQPRYWQKLDSPVARVFDVARKVDEEDDSTDLVLLSRSNNFTPSEDIAMLRQDVNFNQRVYVNRTNSGQWYALSEQNYPGATASAKLAGIEAYPYSGILDLQGELSEIVGVHLLSHEKPLQEQLTIGDRPSDSSRNEMMVEPEKGIVSDTSTLQMKSTTPSRNAIPKLFGSLFCVILLVFAWEYRNPGYVSKLLGPNATGKRRITVGSQDKRVVEVTEAPQSEVQIADSQQGGSIEELDFVVVANTQGPVTPQHSRMQSMASNTSQKREDDASDGEGDSEDDNDTGENGTQEKKRKKTKRGNRGGRGRKKNRADAASFEPKPVMSNEKHLRDGMVQVGRLTYDSKLESCLGQGSSGTAVFPGTFDGRVVAVKRLVKTANSLAEKEIRHLVSSDEHPNVIRYHGKEESPSFFYIALDRFDTSLDQFVEYHDRFPALVSPTRGYDVKDALRQITRGVQHLHSLKLVHRDIKPQNILVRPVKTNRPVPGLAPLLFVISDFGLCKPLEDGPESVFAATRTAAGTTGWKAPELLVSSRDAIAAPLASTESTQSQSRSRTASSSISENGTVVDPPSGRRATKAIDIFSLGCVFFYVLTRGAHPFDKDGSPLARDLNIKEDQYDTSLLRQSFSGYDYDAEDLIMQMITHNPKFRPDTAGVLSHPYFWKVEHKLDFLCLVSDNYEERKQKVTNIHDENASRSEYEEAILNEIQALQDKAPNVLGVKKDGSLQSFLDALPRSFLNAMGKQRKYTGTKMIDLLRAIRNKKNHFQELPDDVKEMMLNAGVVAGGVKNSQIEGYYAFWRDRFPSLLVNCHQLLQERDLVDEFGMERYYDGSLL